MSHNEAFTKYFSYFLVEEEAESYAICLERLFHIGQCLGPTVLLAGFLSALEDFVELVNFINKKNSYILYINVNKHYKKYHFIPLKFESVASGS